MIDSWQEEKEGDISSEEFETLCDEAFKLRETIDELKAQQRNVQEQLNRKTEKVMAHLEQVGKTKHAGRLGTLSLKIESYPAVPKEPAKKQLFFDYLKTKGVFDDFITVNAQTLRGFYKAQKAAEDDNPDFNIPGLEPFERVSLTFRRSK